MLSCLRHNDKISDVNHTEGTTTMGGTTSKLEATDWLRADGKIQSTCHTLDGAIPTIQYGIYYLTKKAVMTQREYDVTDENHNLLYTTRAVPGTIACFDVLGPGIDDFRLRVTVDIARRYWIVYRSATPYFDGQRYDIAAKEKLLSEVYDDHTTVNSSSLYRCACITVSWSRYMAVVVQYGAPTAELLVAYNKESRGRTFSNIDSSDFAISNTQPDMFGEASKIAARMRRRTSSTEQDLIPQASTNDDGVIVPSKDSGDTTNRRHDHCPQVSLLDEDDSEVTVDDGADCHSSLAETYSIKENSNMSNSNNETSTNDEHPAVTTSASMPEMHSCTETDHMDHEIRTVHSAIDIPTPVITKSRDPIAPHATRSSPTTTTTSANVVVPASPASSMRAWWRDQSNIIREKSQQVYETSVAATVSVTNSLSLNRLSEHSSSDHHHHHHHHGFHPKRDPMEGVLRLDLPILLCQEIYNKIIGNHQTSIISKEKALELLQQDMAQHDYTAPKNKDNNNNNNNNGDDNDNNNDEDDELNAVVASARDNILQNQQQQADNNHEPPQHYDSVEVELNTAHHHSLTNAGGGGGAAAAAAGNISALPSIPRSIATPDEENNVTIHVLSNLSINANESSVREISEPTINNYNGSKILPLSSNNRETRPDPPGNNSLDLGNKVSRNNDDDDDDEIPSNALPESDTLKSVIVGVGSHGANDTNDDDVQPLVGYWSWNNTLRVHRMKMHLAKNSDLALHVVLAIIVNQVRYERNAVAITM
jgi:hypothetical protein